MNKKSILTWVLMFSVILGLCVPTAFAEGSKTVTVGVSESLKLGSLISLPTTSAGISTLKLEWAVGNKSIVKIDSLGKITGLQPGTTTVTAKIKNNAQLYTSFQVNVVNKVTGITITKSTMDLKIGQKDNILYQISPPEMMDTQVVWSSSNSNVARIVPTTGAVTALNKGTAVMTGTTKDGGYRGICVVNVSPTVTGIQVTDTAITMNVGEKHPLQAMVLPIDAFEKTILYTIAPVGVVRITGTGLVTALKEGTATVTLITKDGGFRGTSVITVNSDVDKVFIVDSNNVLIPDLSLRIGETYTAKAVKNLTDLSSLVGYTLKWSSSDPTVAVSKPGGVIQPIKQGTAVITVEVTQDTSHVSASFPLTVLSTVTGLELSKTETSLAVGQSETLGCTVVPETAFDKKVKWMSSDMKVVKVYGNRITGAAEGIATLTAITEDGGFKKECIVTVKSLTDGIFLPEVSASIPLGDTYKSTPVLLPPTALVKTITATVSDATGIAVRKGAAGEFTITGLKPGQYNVTFTSTDGKKTAVLSVTVVPRDLDITIRDSGGEVISKD